MVRGERGKGEQVLVSNKDLKKEKHEKKVKRDVHTKEKMMKRGRGGKREKALVSIKDPKNEKQQKKDKREVHTKKR